ncbi:ABC transporter permease [Actinomadura vinacea]|uniref:ABC transporter permease n=1 Tax=Actinomadura vinacea TaxID=115336 RepID=A0ABN3JTZ6_9ACTN
MTERSEGMSAARAGVGQRLRLIVPALVAGLVVVGAWQALVRGLDVQAFILPAPSDIAGALAEGFGAILPAAAVTVRSVLLGLVAGTVLGVLAALVTARLRGAAGPVLTAAVVLNCAPIIALAPIFNNWFGVTSLWSKVAVAAIMVFFPVLVNTTRGLLEVAPLHLEVLDAMAATPRQVTLLVRLPGALPHLLSAVKLGATLSVIGVIVSEYFGGSVDTLGVYIAQMAALPRYAEAWAGILVSGCLGLILFGLVNVLERLVMPWHVSLRSD